MAYSDSVIQAESGGDPNSADPNSSASGLYGFTNPTWLSTVRANRPDLAGKSDDELIALKSDPTLSKQMMDALTASNQGILTKNGFPANDTNTYLAHFAGPGGAVSILKADPSASATDILGPAAAKANPFLKGMTASDLIAWAGRKMGAQAPQTAPQAAQPAPQGILSQTAQNGQPPGQGILNTPEDPGTAFRNTLAQLMANQPQMQAQPLAPIHFAVPRARLLAALQRPVGG